MLSDEVYISLESLMYFGSVFPENTARGTGAYVSLRRCMRSARTVHPQIAGASPTQLACHVPFRAASDDGFGLSIGLRIAQSRPPAAAFQFIHDLIVVVARGVRGLMMV